jgi:hypothetical protein
LDQVGLSFGSRPPLRGFTPSARLPRDVPEKAEAFLREALCAASDEQRFFVAMMTWLAAPDQRKASFFQTHHEAVEMVGTPLLILKLVAFC